MPDLPNELSQVELPFVEQLKGLGWQYLPGDVDVPYLTERESFRQVLLDERLRKAVRRINLDDKGQPWLDNARINQAVNALERLGVGGGLMEANRAATELLLKGTPVEGDSTTYAGRTRMVRFIDFDRPENNDFLVVNQFRVDVPGGPSYIVPDLVLFVNGIPLVVVECKSPSATNPMEEGITQLLRYSNQRDWFDGDEGNERLFHFNQLLVSTFWHHARVGTIGASYEHFLEWKDTSPVPQAQVASALGVENLSSQQLLVAGMLRKEHLLDLVRHFTLFVPSATGTIKIVARYQQFRAVHNAIHRLRTGQTRLQHGESGQRGGIIWHTQGSGKSYTMVFLVRKLRTSPDLRRLKVVVVTDRNDLQTQLSETATLTGESILVSSSTRDLKEKLRRPGPDVVFATIQKYQGGDDEAPVEGGIEAFGDDADERKVAEEQPRPYRAIVVALDPNATLFPVLNASPDILVLVDEAHRTHASELHANLMRALPNCAKIGFTGTPIIMGARKKTEAIFGPILDRYTIKQSEDDGATVPILYEGREVKGEVVGARDLDALFEDMFDEHTPEDLEKIKARYARAVHVLEAEHVVAAKAEDILRHYVDVVLPGGFKAQIVAASRLAAVRYCDALAAAHAALLRRLAALDPGLSRLSGDELDRLDADTQFLVRAQIHLPSILRLEFAAVISGYHNDPPVGYGHAPAAWRDWTDKAKAESRITRFKKPLVHSDRSKQDGLAFLCVKNMLLTGFDAPVEQVMYLDRFIQEHELLQAIARVNRTAAGKLNGLVVDYFGVTTHLSKALAAYTAEDVAGALLSVKDELPKLVDRHLRVVAVFTSRGVTSIRDVNACVDLLRDARVRAEFIRKLKQFLESLDTILPRPEALPYVRDARILGLINKTAANIYRDPQLNLVGAGAKVRELIDAHVVANGIDPKIPPISILDASFDDVVNSRWSDRAKASEMEHAARQYITAYFAEDPAHYGRLSERLEAILQEFHDNWAELVKMLRELASEIKAGRPADQTGLDPRTQAPFLGVLVEEVGGKGKVDPVPLMTLAEQTVEIVDHVRSEVRRVDFWRNLHAQNVLRSWIARFLDDRDTVPLDQTARVADRLVELAKALHTRLTS